MSIAPHRSVGRKAVMVKKSGEQVIHLRIEHLQFYLSDDTGPHQPDHYGGSGGNGDWTTGDYLNNN